MILKAGVRARGASPELLIALYMADQVYGLFETNMVITSMNDGRHSLKSKHWRGDAADLRTKNLPQHVDPQDVVREIKERIGPDYDVILEFIDTNNEHIHLEYDPKGEPG